MIGIEQQGFIVPDPSRSSRKINWRSRASCRGTIVLSLNSRQQVVVYESLLELMCILLISSRGDLADVWDQPEPIRFTLPDGSHHEHTFDYRVTLTDGLRYAVAIKPIHHVEKYDFDLKLGYICAALPDAFADEVILMSEADFTRAQALNAQRYYEFTKKPDTDADDHIVRVAYEQHEPTVLEDLIAKSRLGGRGFRAGFRAIIEGKLKPLSHGKIGLQTMVSSEVPI
ncbi:hypothetical protein [Sulfitobacter geojensis]|uniref:TnsA endonuclease N-terminal domain-containing protein n=2 Tax=Sulfitobacter geojensis TaxID=1342299 RepID=A0AAE2VY17_9RHOB|nr:hypothetical protein [Sulfitobacter geojensis]MBM1689274.1 hypothetical protein [Sulfitobacter geojensis]MBM1693340.1 hypothetical protein [Sulfitobacter geojensis]MBM1705506.1 hypothetical protein [Sulfitobacter geojensis]MBM1709564.1 hypothetical protein [Sulfitobacter geojensis]MBM1713630.1 hypothetical protein [Sulfitobacter geojensis]